MHVNTVRAHLAILEEAGLVTSGPEHRGVRGRPRIIYRIADGTGDDDARDSYRLLVRALVDGVAAGSADPARDGERIGELWGRQLVEPSPPGYRPSPEETRDRAIELLASLGFDPRRAPDDPGAITLHHCPYLEVATEHPEVMCRIHLGNLRGALRATGSSAEVSLTPFVTATTCAVRVA